MSIPNTDTADANVDSNLKRKRSPSLVQTSTHTPPTKTVKTSGNQLSINYLARSSSDDLPLATKDDTLPSILNTLGRYSNVLDRHESLASNLGARPLAPILIKRFERCFDSPPTIVASHQRTATTAEDLNTSLTWLEVIEFARSHPGQFTLSTYSEGRRVCQFYLPSKQLRVQITEEDFIFINSGRCQELIPPLPIWEDEEKEISTCDVLETRLKELTNIADMVAARTRQLCHRLKGRRTAILERRAEGGSGTPAKAGANNTSTAHPSAMTGASPNASRIADEVVPSSASLRNELLRHFESLPQNQQSNNGSFAAINGADARRLSAPRASSSPRPAGPSQSSAAHRGDTAKSGARLSTGAISGTPSKHNFSRPLPPAQESTQPFRPLCQAHMDSLARGQRVLPPCDRCRRLKMDCVKNLTSCAGCTKKHARCHWRDVTRAELNTLDQVMDGKLPPDTHNTTIRDATDDYHTIDTGDEDEDDISDEEDGEDMPLTALNIQNRAAEDSTNRTIDVALNQLERSNSSGERAAVGIARAKPLSAASTPANKSISAQIADLDHLDTLKAATTSSIGGFRAMTYVTASTSTPNGEATTSVAENNGEILPTLKQTVQ